MDYIAFNVPQGEQQPILSGLEVVRYADNTFFASIPDIDVISVATIVKYNIQLCPQQVIDGLQFFVSMQEGAKLYKGYSSGQEEEFFDEDFDKTRGIRIKRPMTDQEVTDRYEAIRWLRIRMVRNYFRNKFETLSVNKTPQERATWKLQEDEARAYVLDNTVETPTLSALALAKNTTVSDLVPLVIAAVDNYGSQITQLFVDEETYVNQLKTAQGDDIINVSLPVNTTIIPGDNRFNPVMPSSE